MSVSKSLDKSVTMPGPSVLALGNFDGVHLGHREILKEAVTLAGHLRARAIAFTFTPHPRAVLSPSVPLPLLSTYEERSRLLLNEGLDGVHEEVFSRDFSNKSAEIFFSEYLVRKFNAVGVVVGYDFAFGKGREGSLESLRQFAEASKITLKVLPAFRSNGEVVSSSKIRELLSAGECEKANALLGRAFFYSGIVQRGEARGRLLGFPTANMPMPGKIVLPNGVYATRSEVFWKELGVRKIFNSVTNIGMRPTIRDGVPIEERESRIETHLLDFTDDLYGREIFVSFEKKLRDEQKFPSLDSLRHQIERDTESARNVLENSEKKPD